MEVRAAFFAERKETVGSNFCLFQVIQGFKTIFLLKLLKLSVGTQLALKARLLQIEPSRCFPLPVMTLCCLAKPH